MDSAITPYESSEKTLILNVFLTALIISEVTFDLKYIK